MNLDDLNKERELAFCEMFTIPFPYIPPEPLYSKTVDERKILVLSDPHEPYGAEFVYADALNNHGDAALLVVPGDLGDYYSKSRFRKNQSADFREEVRSVFKRMEWMSAHFRSVKIMMGNHDNRPEKKIKDLLNVDPELLIFTELNLLKHLSCYFHNVEIVEHRIAKTRLGVTYIWQMPETDIVFTHAEISRAQKSATLEYISNWLHKSRHFLGIKDYRVIVQGHNHQSMKTDEDGETWMMVPTASDPYSLGFEYILQRMYKTPPVIGYTVLYHDNGVCDTNASHNIVLRAQ